MDLEGRVRDLTECVDKLDEHLRDEQLSEADLRKAVHAIVFEAREEEDPEMSPQAKLVKEAEEVSASSVGTAKKVLM